MTCVHSSGLARVLRRGYRGEQVRYSSFNHALRTPSLSSSCATVSLQQEDINRVREVLDEFLSKYPLCFGFWNQYAEAEVRHGDRAKEVYEQGLAATPYSIDLWNYYIEWLKSQAGATPDEVRMCVPSSSASVPRAGH